MKKSLIALLILFLAATVYALSGSVSGTVSSGSGGGV